MLLSGKKALVTGARRNIGRGIVQALAEAGCDVGFNDLEADQDVDETLRLVESAGRKTAFFEADISNASDVSGMIDEFVKRFGSIDILVNNPYYGEGRPFLDITEEIWDKTLDVCLKGFFLCSQTAAKEMVRQGTGGSIVSISSVHADRTWLNDTCYGTAKAAILRLTMSMACELAAHNIRCNAVLPGYMDTSHTFGSPAPEHGSAPEKTHGYIPTRRYGTPEDIGRAVTFLSSPHAANINGVALPVDGGLLTTGVT
jgi:NAD(P)-dependent dehydrogenase (short-subunit alcohol dehydrogenase family)